MFGNVMSKSIPLSFSGEDMQNRQASCDHE